MKEYDYSVIKDHKLYGFIGTVFAFLPYLFRNIRIVGKENVPPTGGRLILAANHVNTLDPVVLGFAVTKKHPFYFMSKQELFKNSAVAWFLGNLNGFPIKRGQHDNVAIRYAGDIVKSGRTLGIFVEGTRSRGERPQPAKPGVAIIARDAQADILPVAIYSEKKGSVFAKMTIRFGKVIPHEALGFDGSGSREETQLVAERVMDEIRALWDEKHA